MIENREELNSLQENQPNIYTELEPLVIPGPKITKKQRNIRRCKIFIVFCVLILWGMEYLTGLKMPHRDDSYYVQKKLTQYLEKRYGEKFVLKNLEYWYNDGVQMVGYPKDAIDEQHKFIVQGYFNKWGRMDCYDTYNMVNFIPKYEEYLKTIVGKYYDEFTLRLEMYQDRCLNDDLPADIKLEDFQKPDWKTGAGEVYISLPPGTSMENYKKLILELSDCYYKGRVYIEVEQNKKDGKPSKKCEEYCAYVYSNTYVSYDEY